MSKKIFTSEMLVGITAIIISLSTLVVFIYQTNLIRKQQYMSVYPHLSLSNENTGSVNYRFILQNEGIGPAFITKIEVQKTNGKKYNNLLEFVATKLAPKDSVQFHYSDIYEGKLIQAREEVVLFGLANDEYNASYGLNPNTVRGAHKLRDVLNHDSLEIKITYESIYGESWMITEKSLKPLKN